MTYRFEEFRKLRSKLPKARRHFIEGRPKVISLTGTRLARLLLLSLEEQEKNEKEKGK